MQRTIRIFLRDRGRVPARAASAAASRCDSACSSGLNELAGSSAPRAHQIFELCAELKVIPTTPRRRSSAASMSSRDDRQQRFPVSSAASLRPPGSGFRSARTADARVLLPTEIDRLHAVETCGNACAITAAFASRRLRKSARRLRRSSPPALSQEIDSVSRRRDRGRGKRRRARRFPERIRFDHLRLTLRIAGKSRRAMLRAAPADARAIITTADNRGARTAPQSALRNPNPDAPRLKISNSSRSTSFSNGVTASRATLLRGLLYVLSFSLRAPRAVAACFFIGTAFFANARSAVSSSASAI